MAAPSAMEKLQSMVAASAIHDGKRGEEDYTDVCHPGTREEYLENLRAWADTAPEEMRVQWANAIAGAGKTAMLRTFCTLLEEERGFPPISFFIWKNDLARNTLDRLPATAAAQLCRRIPALVPFVEKAINEDSFLLQSAFKKQMDKLVISPLLDACDAVKGEQHLIFVVDGLDELDTQGQTVFLNFIPYFLSRLSSLPISVLVSSRPEDMIVGAFEHPKLASITRATRIGASDEDILKFLNDKFDDINLRFPYLRINYGGRWPSDKQLAIMVRQSSGLFIWPTVAIRHIDKVEKGLRHNERLEQVVSSADPKPWIASPLDNLYRAILEANAPEGRESVQFLRFKRRLALLCIVDLGIFVRGFGNYVFDWTATLICAVFEETLEELWGSVAGLSSLFSPRTALMKGKSPTPTISHLSLRDFTFNRARCGDELHYSSEREVHAEVVCKFLKFFNTPQVYKNCAEMSGNFLTRAGDFLKSHLTEAVVSEELGRCMDDVMLDCIPHTWPLVTQMYLIVNLFDALYVLAENPDFPEGLLRREALLSKVTAFFKSRAATAEEWDIALFRLALSTANFGDGIASFHSVHCWHIARSPQCACIYTYIRNIALRDYQDGLGESTLFQHAMSRLLPDGQDDVARDSLHVLQFILSLSETSPRATELSSFIPAKIDYWIVALLRYCPPNDDLYNALGRTCTAPLPELPKRGRGSSFVLIRTFVEQADEFNEYTKRCREAGIEANFPPIKIPDDWWEDEDTRNELIAFGYTPPFEIPDKWWEDRSTPNALLSRGYNPPFEIPKEWWQEENTRTSLLYREYKPPFDIPNDWWQDKSTRQLLRRRGYPPPDPYSAEETESESGSDASENEEPGSQDEGDSDHLVTGEDESLTGGKALSGITLPQVPPSPSITNPLHIQQAVASAQPMTTPVVGAEDGQAVPSNVGGRRHRLRDSFKKFFCM